MTDDQSEFNQLRLLEALLFASAEPLSIRHLAERLPEGTDVADLLERLRGHYANRGVTLVERAGRWAFRTAPDLARQLTIETSSVKRLSRAAVETLAIIAYHAPITRAEIEEVRGVSLSKGTLDTLFEAGWIKPKGRRKTPGRPVTWITTETFLDHFGLEATSDLPGLEELKAAGLLDTRPGLTAYRSGMGDGDAEPDRDGEETPEPLDPEA